VTSYPIPPQGYFTCAPYVVRRKTDVGTVRFTYISTRDSTASKITLFEDVLGGSGTSTSIRIVAQKVETVDSIVHISTFPSDPDEAQSGTHDDTLVLTRGGIFICLDGESLHERWRTPSSLLQQELLERGTCDVCVEHVSSARAADVIDGMFPSQRDVLNVFQEKVDRQHFDPHILLLVTRRGDDAKAQRFLHVLAVQPRHDKISPQRQHLIQVYAVPLPDSEDGAASDWQLDVRGGSLQERRGETVTTYDLKSSLPRTLHKLSAPTLVSALRINSTSLLAASATTISVYNPVYRALQSSIDLEPSQTSPDATVVTEEAEDLNFVTLFRSLNIAVAIRGSSILAMQLEAPLSLTRKRRAEGLLIDAIGRGVAVAPSKPKYADVTLLQQSSSFLHIIPGALTKSFHRNWNRDMAKADNLFSSGDLAGFEQLMVRHLGIELRDRVQTNGIANGDTQMNGTEPDPTHATPLEWQWPKRNDAYPMVDRRWLLYSITKVFSLQADDQTAHDGWTLHCDLAGSNLLTYLVQSGALTVANLKAAFKSQVDDVLNADLVLAEQLTKSLADMDASLQTLLAYLHATTLGSTELLLAIRHILASLEIVRGYGNKTMPKLLTLGEDQAMEDAPGVNGTRGEDDENGEPLAISMELDRLEQELDLTTSYLNEDALTGGIRAECLSVAFAQLTSCPALQTVHTLRSLFSPEETLALIQVLRMELIKDGWTTRYQDTMSQNSFDTDQANEEPPPDGSIRLLADLLCRCIDSIGAAGWMVNEGVLNGLGESMGIAEFLAALKLEVSAALEGIQEAVYLRGLLAETVRYGTGLQKALGAGHVPEKRKEVRERGGKKKKRHGRDGKSVVPKPGKGDEEGIVASTLTASQGVLQLFGAPGMNEDGLDAGEAGEQALQMLPLGLKVPARISAEKVVAGGEVVQRSRRETGYLISQKVGPYSVERIEI
jgi:hypothetical protein